MSLVVKKSQITNLMKRILSKGIDLEISDKVEELTLLIKMHRFVNNRAKFRSHIEETKITIETIWFDPLLSVEIERGVMSVIPITDGGYSDALLEVIHFFFFMEQRRVPKKSPKKKAAKPKENDPNEFDWI